MRVKSGRPLCRTKCSVYHLTIAPGAFDAFKSLVEEIVEATSHEPDTTIYEYVASADKTKVHIVERYRTRGLLPHVDQTFAPFAEGFLRLARIDQLYVYGETNAAIHEKLDDFGAEYLTPFAGFSHQ